MRPDAFREIANLSEEEPLITEPGDIRKGHVRINACGQRIVGWVDLPKTEFARCSGLLNDPDVYLMVKRESSTGGQSNEATAVNKESISYIEIVGEEPTTRSWSIPSTFEPVVIELRSPDVVLRGEIFVLADSSVGDALNDGRRFLSVRNAKFLDSAESYCAVRDDGRTPYRSRGIARYTGVDDHEAVRPEIRQ